MSAIRKSYYFTDEVNPKAMTNRELIFSNCVSGRRLSPKRVELIDAALDYCLSEPIVKVLVNSKLSISGMYRKLLYLIRFTFDKFQIAEIEEELSKEYIDFVSIFDSRYSERFL